MDGPVRRLGPLRLRLPDHQHARADASNGGFYHGIVGTLQITGIATLISVPLGLFTAVFLVEYNGGWIARAITFLVAS